MKARPFLLWIVDNLIVIILVVMLLCAALFVPYFFTLTNMINLIYDGVPLGVISIAQGLAICTGNIDLSVESVMSFSVAVAVIIGKSLDLNPFLMLAIVFLVGICIGAINGFFIVKVKINALIVTLCMLMIYRGFTYFLVPQAIAGLPSEFIYLGAKSFSGLPLCLIVLLVLFCLLYIVIKEGRFGRELLGIGGNRKAAFGAGIAVSRLQFLVFIFSSLLASLAGLLMAGKLESVTSSMGQGTVFLTIAAALLGGISMSGGVFPVIGLLAGILVLCVLDTTLSLLRVSPYIVYAIKGIILFAALVVDHFKTYFRAVIVNSGRKVKDATQMLEAKRAAHGQDM